MFANSCFWALMVKKAGQAVLKLLVVNVHLNIIELKQIKAGFDL